MKKMVCIRDNVGGMCFPPMFVNSLPEAVRALKDEMRNEDSRLRQNPSDYDLLHVADFDDSIGAMVAVNGAPYLLLNCSDIVKELNYHASSSSEVGTQET